VLSATGGEQEPFIYGSLSKESIYMVRPVEEAPPAVVTPQPIMLPPGVVPDRAAWDIVKDSSDISSLQRFIKLFPNSQHAGEAKARIAALSRDPPPKPLPDRNTPQRPEKDRATNPPAVAGALPSEPPAYSLQTGQRVLVNDGSCPPGQIKEIIGGTRTG